MGNFSEKQNSEQLEDHNQEILNQFRALAEATAKILNLNKISTRPYDNQALPLFSLLNPTRQQTSLAQLRTYFGTLQACLDTKSATENQSVWSALQLLGLKPTSDIFEKISSDYAIEIYDGEGIQAWRNLTFMSVCSYTLEEMFSLTWQERYERSPLAEKQTTEVVIDIFTGKIKGTTACQIHNQISETCSGGKFVIDVFHEYISPLTGPNSGVSGFIVLSKVKLLRQNSIAYPSAFDYRADEQALL